MSNGKVSTTTHRRQAGFSLIELLVVVGVLMVLAAVSLPNIGGYIRNFKIRGAASQVGSELQTARSKAIMTNTNNGVLFVAVDANSYRFIRQDAPAAERLGPLRELPQGVWFEVAAINPAKGIWYNRMGSWCKPGVSSCAALPPPADLCSTEEQNANRCNQSASDSYLAVDAASGVTLTLLEVTTGLRRTVRVSVGGRILPQP
jgi:prepilin-type N-terminal cleavage/methylation domain-containing protein